MKKAGMYTALTSGFELAWIYSFTTSATWWRGALSFLSMCSDSRFLRKACESLLLGTVYAIFAAAGTVGTALMDVFLFEESLTFIRIIFMGLILIGVIGLKLADDLPQKDSRQQTEQEVS